MWEKICFYLVVLSNLLWTLVIPVAIRSSGLELIQGDPAELICDKTFPYVTNNMDIPMKWSFDGKKIGECSYTGCDSTVHMANKNTSLVYPISKVQRYSHSGRWTCDQTLVVTYSTVSVDLDVKVAVETVSISPSDASSFRAGQLHVVNLQSVSLSCTSSPSKPVATVSWYTEPGSSLSFDITTKPVQMTVDDLFVSSSTATFTPSIADQGIGLYCEGKNIDSKPAVTSQHIPLNVSVPVSSVSISSVKENLAELFLKESQETSMTCTTSPALPAATIEWVASSSQNTFVMYNTGNLETQSTSNGLLISTSQLTIMASRSSDGETIHCVARNTDGQQQTSYKARLRIYYPPAVTAWAVYDGVPRVGGSVELKCTADSNPAANIEWSKYNGFLPDGSVSSASSILSIPNLKCSNAGIYICSAENNAFPGKIKSANVTLDTFSCVPSVPSELTVTFPSSEFMKVRWKTENELSMTTYIVQIRGVSGTWKTIHDHSGDDVYMHFQYNITGFEATVIYDIRIYATNSEGKSPGYLTGEFQLPGNTPTTDNKTVIIAATVSGVAIVLISIVIVVACCVYLKRRKKREAEKMKSSDGSEKDSYENIVYRESGTIAPTAIGKPGYPAAHTTATTQDNTTITGDLRDGGYIYPISSNPNTEASPRETDESMPYIEVLPDNIETSPREIDESKPYIEVLPDNIETSPREIDESKPYIEILPDGIVIRNPEKLMVPGSHVIPTGDGYLYPVKKNVDEGYAEIDESKMYDISPSR